MRRWQAADEHGNVNYDYVVYDCGHYPETLGKMSDYELAQHTQWCKRFKIGDYWYCRTNGRLNYAWRTEVLDTEYEEIPDAKGE